MYYNFRCDIILLEPEIEVWDWVKLISNLFEVCYNKEVDICDEQHFSKFRYRKLII